MGTDGSCFYYEKTALRTLFLKTGWIFSFSTASPIYFFFIFSEASVEQEVWNLAADLAASYFVDTYLLTESPEATERQKIYVKLPPGARSAEKFYSFLAGYQLKKGKAFLPARRMTTAAGFQGDGVFGSFTGVGGTEAFFREHLLTVVTVLVLAALPARIFPRRRLLLPVRSSFSGFGKHWSFSLFPLSLPLPGKRAAAAQLPGAASNGFCWRKRGATISAAI